MADIIDLDAARNERADDETEYVEPEAVEPAVLSCGTIRLIIGDEMFFLHPHDAVEIGCLIIQAGTVGEGMQRGVISVPNPEDE